MSALSFQIWSLFISFSFFPKSFVFTSTLTGWPIDAQRPKSDSFFFFSPCVLISISAFDLNRPHETNAKKRSFFQNFLNLAQLLSSASLLQQLVSSSLFFSIWKLKVKSFSLYFVFWRTTTFAANGLCSPEGLTVSTIWFSSTSKLEDDILKE